MGSDKAASAPGLPNLVGERGASNSRIDLQEEEDDDEDGVQYPARKKTRQEGDRDHPIAIEDDELVVTSEITASMAAHSDLIVLDGSDEPEVKEPVTTPPFRCGNAQIPGNSAVETGESSSRADAHWTEPEAYCGVCMESIPQYLCFPVGGCSHTYCADCVRQYVAAKVGDNVTSIGCIDPGCRVGFLEPQMCRFILPPEVFDRWGRALCDAMIMEPMKFYCPYKDCSALLINDNNNGGEVIRDCECPHCFRLFCAQCKVPWHAGVACQEYEKLGNDERSQEDLKLLEMAKESNWQRCPKCKYYVEKISGCMFVRCSVCLLGKLGRHKKKGRRKRWDACAQQKNLREIPFHGIVFSYAPNTSRILLGCTACAL